MAINDPNLAYMRMVPAWELTNALWGDTPAMRAAGTKYLPARKGELEPNSTVTNAAYDTRLKETTLVNHFGTAIRGLSGKVFQKPILIGETLTSKEDWWNDIDLAGNNINDFGIQVFEAGLRHGVSYILVDAPVEGDATNLADQIKQNIRSRELRFTTWNEIDFDERMWLIPSERMKMSTDHFVPLTDQVIELFRELQQFNGNREFVFASPQRPKQPLSSNAMIQLIYRMGYKNKATIHGFRTTASTYLNETGYNRDAIERQLSHAERNHVRAAYNRSEYLEERKRLLRDWSRYLDSLSNNVVPIQKVK